MKVKKEYDKINIINGELKSIIKLKESEITKLYFDIENLNNKKLDETVNTRQQHESEDYQRIMEDNFKKDEKISQLQ